MSVSAQEAGINAKALSGESNPNKSPKLREMGALGVTVLKMFDMIGTTPTPVPPISPTESSSSEEIIGIGILCLVGVASFRVGMYLHQRRKAWAHR